MKANKALAAFLSAAVLLTVSVAPAGAASAAASAAAGKTAPAATAASKTAAPAQSGGKNPAAQAGPTGVNAKSYVLAEASTGRILAQKDAHDKMPPASITKIMTELLTVQAIEQGKLKWTELLTCSAHAASMGGSDIWLEPGEKMSVKDLFKAMAISSANDAAVVFAEKIGGSEQGFANMMNKEAKTLGMNDTHFVNANGLDADGHVTSAYDVMLMSRELLKHQEIFNYTTVWMDSLRGGKTQLVNTNRLIRTYTGINGLKTGSTSKAGYCISATAKRDGMELIAVIMGADNMKERFSSAANLLDYGFGGWEMLSPKPKQTVWSVNVLHGVTGSVQARLGAMPQVLAEKGGDSAVEQKANVVQEVEAPIQKGQVLGQVSLLVDGKSVGTVPVTAVKAVDRMTFARAFSMLARFLAR